MADCASISHGLQPICRQMCHRHSLTLVAQSPRATAGPHFRRLSWWPIRNSSANSAIWTKRDGFNYNQERSQIPTRRTPFHDQRVTRYSTPRCSLGVSVQLADTEALQQGISTLRDSFKVGVLDTSLITTSDLKHGLLLMDLDPATAKLAIPFIGPFLSAFGFLFILRIVMSWYPKLPVGKFPYVVAYAPTEPILNVTRKVIPPLGGVDVTPVVWFGLLSFLNEILVGPQGLLVLLSQQV